MKNVVTAKVAVFTILSLALIVVVVMIRQSGLSCERKRRAYLGGGFAAGGVMPGHVSALELRRRTKCCRRSGTCARRGYGQ